MDSYSFDNGEKPSASNETSSNADMTTHHELLNAPNRYADGIQGELVRLGQVNRTRYSYDYGSASYTSSIYSHSVERRSETTVSTNTPTHISSYVPPLPQTRNLPGIPSHYAYHTNTIFRNHSTPYSQQAHSGLSDGFSPQQPYSMPSIADIPALWHNQTMLQPVQSHLPTPVDDTQHIDYSAQDICDDERQSSHSRDMSLSDGELVESNDYGYMSEGEVRPDEDQPEDRDVDVATIVKKRIAGMLKLRDPKLLQSPKLRALMLLVKCIKLEDPDEICTHIKNATIPTASELSMLAQEFNLTMIADACANAVLAAATDFPDAAMLHETTTEQSTLEETDRRESSNEIDMDTSSDVEFEQVLPQITASSKSNAPSTEPLDDSQPDSRQDTTSLSDFSRSRAPSPPNTHSHVDRSSMLAAQQPLAQATSEITEDISACSPELVGMSLVNSAIELPQAGAWDLGQPPVDSSIPASEFESDAVCVHENDSFVVYVDDSASSSGAESDLDIDEHAGSSSVSSLVNIQTTPTASLPISRTQSYASTPNAGSAVSSLSNYAASSADSLSTERLRKAKQELIAHEAEIARLKLQIKQRQTKALLMQKMQRSKQQQPKLHMQAVTTTANTTAKDPYTEPSAASVAKEPPPDTSASSTVQSPTPIAEAESDTPKLSKLPSLGYAAQFLPQVPSDIRNRHISTITTHLDNAIELKRMALSLTRRTSNIMSKAAQQSFAQASERLATRQQRFQAEQNKLQQLLQCLNATVKLVEAEQRFLNYSSSANNELQDIVSIGTSTQSLQDLESEIQAIMQLKEETNDLNKSIEITDKVVDTDDLLRMVVDSDASLPQTEDKSTATEKPGLDASIAVEPDKPSPDEPTVSKPEVAAMRAKMAAMQEEQSTMSQRLSSLVEKRKQEAVVSSISSQKSSKKAKTAGTASRPTKDSPNSTYTSMRLVRKTIEQAIEEHTGPYELWCMSMTNELDSCILQPLIVVDDIGIPGLISADLPDGAAATSTKQLPAAALEPASKSGLDQRSEDSLVKGDSALYITNTTASKVNSQDVSIDYSNVDLSKLTSKHLLAAIGEAPKNGLGAIRKYYKDLQCALAVFSSNDEGTLISNDELAHAMLPVWNNYKHHFSGTGISKSNPLYNVLDLANVGSLPALNGNHLTRKERSYVLQLVRSNENTPPILNRDILYFPAHSESQQEEADSLSSAKKTKIRYFDMADVVESDNNKAALKDNPDEKDKQATEEDVLYDEALQIFRKGLPTFKRPTMVNDLMMYLGVRVNKNLGKAVLKLRDALEQYPKSEKLWDLYLELYTRQRASEKDVVSTFSDATRFNPYSICIWRRYIVWCGCHASQTKTKSDTIWLDRLRMVTSMALKLLASAQAAARKQERSAAIAEFLVYFWKCLYASYFASQGQAPVSATFPPLLLDHMHACLSATSVQTLSDEVASVNLLAAQERPSTMDNSKWNGLQWILSDLLLPHHLLLVGQVFANSFITAQFIPRKVLDKLLAVLYSAPSSHTAFFIDWNKVVQSKSDIAGGSAKLEPYVASIVVKLYTQMRKVLNRPIRIFSDDMFGLELTSQSARLCSASINATFSQMRHQEQKAVKQLCIESKELLWHFYDSSLSNDDIRRIPHIMSICDIPLLLSFAMCANGFPGTSDKITAAVQALWRHAFYIAKHANIDISSMRSAEAALDPGSQNEDTKLQLIETRTLYYRLVGYTSSWSPTSLQRLKQIMPTSGCSKQSSNKQNNFPSGAWIWINIALVELLHISIVKNQQLLDAKSIDIALAWLKYGLKRLHPNDMGSRAQIWAFILRITMAQRHLTLGDIAMAHKDLEMPPITLGSSENIPPSFMLINSILQPIIVANPSDSTLKAIGHYLSTIARSNSELAVRLIEYVSVSNRNQPDLKNMVRKMSFLDIRDFAD